jgi:hypothetical protein
MSLIVAEVYDALIEAGTSEEKAKAAAGAIPVAKSLLTKEDLDGLKEGIDKRFAKIEERFAKIDERFVKMDERFVKIERDLAVLKFGYGPVILALLVKIAFFS